MPTAVEDRLLAAERTLEAARAELAALRAQLLPEPVPASPPEHAGDPWPERPGLGARLAAGLEGLAGPRPIAWAGGVTILLGIAFLFAMAVRQGWVGEGLRLAIGGAASLGLVGGAALLRRRVGRAPVVALAAGAGLGGAFVTLAAAVALYELVPGWAGSLAAELMAAGAVALALSWRMQSVAALGLAGAVACAPVMAGGIGPEGTAFALVAYGAACALQRHRRWTPTLLLATAAIVPQAVWLALTHDPVTPWATAAVVAGTALAALRGAAERQRAGGEALAPAALAVLLGGSLVAAAGVLRMSFGAGWEAASLLPAAAYLGWAGWLLVRGRDRALRTALGAIGLAFLGSGLLTALDGAARVAVPAALGLAALALGPRLGEPRLRWAALWLGGVAGAGALLAAPPGDLAGAGAVGWPAIAAAAVLAAALAAAARLAPERRERLVAAWSALAAGAYAAALAVLRVADALAAEPAAGFQRGHAAVSALAVAAGLAGVALWARRGGRRLRPVLHAGLVLLAAGLAKAFLFDLSQLMALERALAFMAVGAALLAAGALLAWRRARRGEAVAAR